ncbi:hypothetical protein L7F22_031044 [Adiantum nelumboides]|nr:hypothetical protein [Adiantum nelumboides]
MSSSQFVSLPPLMSASTDMRSDPSSQAGQGQYTLNSKVMVAAMLLLCIVVLFVLSLHAYAKWFWREAASLPFPLSNAPNASWRRRWRNLPAGLAGPDPSTLVPAICIGLDPSIICSLPTFIYQASFKHLGDADAKEPLLECAVCLSEFQSFEKGKILPDCKHSFHINCIDMWFRTHSTCPLCRTPVLLWTPQHHTQNLGIWSESTSPSPFLALPISYDQGNEQIATLSILQTTSLTAMNQCPHAQRTTITPLPGGNLGCNMPTPHEDGIVKDEGPLLQQRYDMHVQDVPPSSRSIDGINGSSSTIAAPVQIEGPATSIARCQSLSMPRCQSEDTEASAALRPIKSQSFRMSIRWLLSRDISRGKGRIFPSAASEQGGAELGQDHQVEQSSMSSSLPL